MTENRLSLLDDPLFQVRKRDGEVTGASLTSILSSLMVDDVESFEALQPHQQQPWYSFLVQVAAMAVARAGRADLPGEADDWRALLVELADGSESAWHLVVDDSSEPAFMQSPIPEGGLEKAGYKADTPTPDTLDMLIASKTHDIKQRRMTSPKPEHWIYALLTLQTLEGFLGRGNYGIVRMNGGFGNRPFVGLAPELSWGARVRRDIGVLIDHRDQIIERHGFDKGGHALLWLEPWDGGKKSGVPLAECDPFFVEICRRLRFTSDAAGNLVCWRKNTSGQRIDAPDDLNGQTGDPWTPVEKAKGKALTLGGDGFTYEKLQQIWLEDDFERPPTMEFQADDPDHAYLIATSLVRGQGKTEGWHRRIIPVPPRVASHFMGPKSDRQALARRARERVRLAAEVQSKVLRGPTLTLVYGGRSPSQPDWDKVNKWIVDFDRHVDARFFDALWDSVQQELSDDEASVQWQGILKDIATDKYAEIREGVPLPSIHRYRVLSAAEKQFHNGLRRVLGRAFDQEKTRERGAI